MARKILFYLGLILLCFGGGLAKAKAADFEIILGSSSAFNVVRGASVAGGTSILYVGSTTVSIGTTTQSAMLYVAGTATVTGTLTAGNALRVNTSTLVVDATNGRVGIGTTTPATLFTVGTTTNILNITDAGKVGVGTTTPGTALYVIGTITATTGFSGDGSALTGINATVGGASNINTTGTINAGSTTVSTFTTTGSITAGNAGGFKVDSAGSMTATTITSTGSATVTGTLTAGGGFFTVGNTGSMTAAGITSTSGANLGSTTVTTLTAGSATVTGPVLIGTNTPNLGSALYVGSSTGSLGTITGGYLSVGTISANLGLQGTTTVRFLADIFANGTVTATGFRGDGSALTGVASTPGASSVGSAQIVDGSISTADLSGTISVSTTGTINAGSTTVTTLTTTGSATVTGTLTAASSTFMADATRTYVTTRVGIGTTTPSSSYLLQVTNDSDTGVTIGSGGSMTAKTLAVAGTATVTGTLTASNALRVNTSTLVVDATNGRVGIGTTTPATLFTVGTTTNILNITDAGKVGVGTTTPGTALYVIGTITATGEITSRNNGMVVKLEPSPMGEIYFTNNATSTTIATASVYVKAVGVTTFEPNSMYFGTSNTNNKLLYTGTSTKVFHVAMTASYTCGNAKVVSLAIAKNGTTTGMEKSIIKDTTSSATDAESTAIHVMPVLNQNDYIEVFVTNLTDTTAVTLQTLNMFAMGMSRGTD